MSSPDVFNPTLAASKGATALRWSDCLAPDWQVASSVRALVTTRNGGVSAAPFGRWQSGVPAAGGLNLGLHTGDELQAVELNRGRLNALVGATPAWLTQVHGCRVVQAEHAIHALQQGTPALSADASVTDRPGVACVVMVADCMPVLLADAQGRAVGAAHAGWRGLLDGVIEETVARLTTLAGVNPELCAFLGPAIGAQKFEVGAEVRTAFLDAASQTEREATEGAFVPCSEQSGKYLANLVALAHLRLARVGIVGAAGGKWCTVSQAELFYSYRRDGKTGRFAGLIWMDPAA